MTDDLITRAEASLECLVNPLAAELLAEVKFLRNRLVERDSEYTELEADYQAAKSRADLWRDSVEEASRAHEERDAALERVADLEAAVQRVRELAEELDRLGWRVSGSLGKSILRALDGEGA